MRITALIAAAALAGFAAPALAEDVTLDRPIEAGSLHEGPLDLVAYYTETEDGAFEVTATFAPKSEGEAGRVVMALGNGDAVQFALPGHNGAQYAFAREDDAVRISVDASFLTARADGIAAQF